MSLMVLHISLILLKLIGSKDFFQFCLISLAIGLHFLTASLELSLLLLCELWALLVTTWLRSGSTCSGIALLIVFLAMSHAMLLAMMSTRTTELISILGVEFKQAGCLLVVKTIFLDDSVGTVLHHLSLVGLLAVLALTLLLFLGESC